MTSLISTKTFYIMRHYCRHFLFFLSTILFLFSCNIQTRVVWLDELNLTNADQSAGKAVANKSMWNTPLVIASDTFKRGVGTHAAGIIRIKLDGRTTNFRAKVGIDDSAPIDELNQASAEFIVIGDGKILWESGVMHGGEKAQKVEVSTKKIKSLLLRVDPTADGTIGDRANWVNAQFDVNGKSPITETRKKEKEYILTPVEPKEPKINAPYRYGARPESPFLFSVPVSGERPMKFKAENLPENLAIDTVTGIISGKAKLKGTYLVDISATNQFGSAKSKLTIEIGDKIALTPPMGWNSWNVFGADISESKIRSMADAMVSTNLINYGYSYINIDDGWQGNRGGIHNAIMPNEKFTDMKGLVDYVHSKGLKIGIYSSPWVKTYAGYVGGSADFSDGKAVNPSRRYGDYSFAENDVKQWVDWGFDYVKYDWMPNDVKHTSELTELLRHSGRDIVYSISNAAPFQQASDWSNLTNAWRTTGDIQDSWCSLTTIGFLQDKWQSYAKPGSWNDPDMLIVGKVGWGNGIHATNLSPNEQYLHISLWSILAAPLLVGCDMTLLDDFTLSLLKNDEVIGVDQDVAGIQGSRIFSDPEKLIEVWSKPLNDGSKAVGFFNLGENKQTISISWNQLKVTGKQLVRDLWKQKNIGIFNNNFSAEVPTHGVVFIKIIPSK